MPLLAAAALAAAAVVPTPEDIEAQMDRIFAAWDRADSPGCAVGALDRGEFVFRKGYGSADLDDGIPITPDSVFRMASVSKQFTAAAVLLGEDRGLFTLEDRLSKHFPDLPAWAERVRIRHLIHHTSGIRDYLALMALRGQGEDHYRDEDVLAALRRLERLNFEPGSEYLYSNSGYWLLARLILRTSGQTLREFAGEHLLGPVGMDGSHFHDRYREVVPGRAHGYRPLDGGGFELDETTLEMVGDGGLYTSVNELAHWERMFLAPEFHTTPGRDRTRQPNRDSVFAGATKLRGQLDPARFGPHLVERMTTPGRLADGARQDYAAGLALGGHRGLATVEHGGGFVGFRTHSLRFPEQDFAVFVLCNSASAEPSSLARSAAEVFLADAMAPATAAGGGEPVGADRLPPGAFHAPRLGSAAEVRLDDEGGLLLVRGGSGQPLRDAGDELAVGSDGVRLLPTEDGFVLREPGQRNFRFLRVEPWAPDLAALVGLAGSFRSTELEADYEVRVDSRPGITLVLPGGGETPLDPLFRTAPDAGPAPGFRSPSGTVRFLPDPAVPGQARGFVLAAGRARGFVFLRR